MADPLRGPGAGPVDSVHEQRRSAGSDQGRVHVPCAAGQPHGRALLANVLGARGARGKAVNPSDRAFSVYQRIAFA